MFLGFEFVKNDGNKTPDKDMALNVIEMLRDEHILTSVIGHYGNILKLRPPMVFSENDIDWFATSLDKCITKPLNVCVCFLLTTRILHKVYKTIIVSLPHRDIVMTIRCTTVYE